MTNMAPINPSFIEKLQFNENGLIPAIAQDWLDGAVLMMAWMNKISLQETIKTNEVHYWSRSRKELWRKGATSGHIQKLKEIKFDCDLDCLLLTVEQEGNIACHTGQRSCFFNRTQKGAEEKIDRSFSLSPDSCSELFAIIENRKSLPEKGSYTNKLLKGGDNLILKKIGEESAEFVMACKDKNAHEIATEAADLIFHLQVAIANHDVSWRDVLEILRKRQGGPRRE